MRLRFGSRARRPLLQKPEGLFNGDTSNPKARCSATFACPRSRTVRPPCSSLRCELQRSMPERLRKRFARFGSSTGPFPAPARRGLTGMIGTEPSDREKSWIGPAS